MAHTSLRDARTTDDISFGYSWAVTMSRSPLRLLGPLRASSHVVSSPCRLRAKAVGPPALPCPALSLCFE